MANVRRLFKWILCICGISKLQECDLLNEFCTTKCQNNVHSLSFWPVIRGLIVLLRIFVDVGFLKRLDLSFFIRVSTHKQALVPSLTMEMISLIKYLRLKWNNSLLIVMRGHDITQDIHRFYGSRNIFFIILNPWLFYWLYLGTLHK